MILRRFTVPGNPVAGGAVEMVPLMRTVRVIGLAVQVSSDGQEKPSIRWRVLSKDGTITLPSLTAESVPTGVGVTDAWFSFMSTQQRDALVPDSAAPNVIVVSGFIPADFWLAPSEILRVEFGGDASSLLASTITQAVVSYLDDI